MHSFLQFYYLLYIPGNFEEDLEQSCAMIVEYSDILVSSAWYPQSESRGGQNLHDEQALLRG